MDNQETIKKYLLGVLSHEEHPDIEGRILTDSSLFEELLIAEDELIDQYLRGELSETERKNFESHFLLPPERQQKVRFARALRKYIATTEHEQTPTEANSRPQTFSERWSLRRLLRARSPALAFSLATVVLLFALGISWMLYRNWQRPDAPHQSLAVVLTPGLFREETGEIKKITVPPDVDTVELRLIVPTNDYQSYRAVLQSREVAEVFVKDQLSLTTTGPDRYISFNVPASLLKHDDYQVKLSGHLTADKYEDVNRYSFRVIK